MERLFEISPKFAELKEFFEGRGGEAWAACGEQIDGEINGGYFHWALIDAVKSRGYYKTAVEAEKYYTDLADEINRLCDEGVIESRCGKRVSNTCYFDFEDLINVVKQMHEIIKYQYMLNEVSMEVSNISENSLNNAILKNKELFEDILNEDIQDNRCYESNFNKVRLVIIETINKIYKIINPYLFYISLLCFIIAIILNLKKLKNLFDKIMVLLSLAILYLSRMFIITFTSTMMFKEALNVSYLSSAYNIQFIFSILSIIFLINSIKKNIYTI